MIVEVVVPVYNEELLLPFFLKHYSWVDKITVLFTNDSNDRSLEILENFIDVPLEIIHCDEPKRNNFLRIDRIMTAYQNSSADWILNVDCDEFIFIDKSDLEKIPEHINTAIVNLYNIYPHASEQDLNLDLPVRDQRRHGKYGGSKPIINRKGQDYRFNVGKHSFESDKNAVFYEQRFDAAHWKNASLSISIKNRILCRQKGFCENDIKNNWGFHEYNITEKRIFEEFMEHYNDPEVL